MGPSGIIDVVTAGNRVTQWCETHYHCPSCGANQVWGEYQKMLVGHDELYYCVDCMFAFAMPLPGEPDYAALLQLRMAVANLSTK